ncbi:cation diffusion facilitator family transporter [Kineosporia sp. J2-2]|uniref:Cation diffusion facilitator family transporter n=1 Tax=Kineosporia corallincola TaxID=2835133 RepID=A0ABS5TLQ7_9ACTN|nr:cation diffusion facilitator family transporter [Kineosporia corallincola]MBT0770983.1 cation diffusion facilitator family transporter [Kineosporia corallincola]
MTGQSQRPGPGEDPRPEHAHDEQHPGHHESHHQDDHQASHQHDHRTSRTDAPPLPPKRRSCASDDDTGGTPASLKAPCLPGPSPTAAANPDPEHQNHEHQDPGHQDPGHQDAQPKNDAPGDHAHGHGHGHGHSHDLPTGPGARRRLSLVLGITVSVLLLEAVGAVLTGSLALLADAGHMLTDAAGLTLSLVVAILAERPPTAKLTWGWKRAEVLSAALQATALLAIGIYILVEGVQRLIDPPEVASAGMIVFGAIGLLANAVSILILVRGQGENMNTRAAFLEVVNDALGSVAVLVAAAAIWITGWDRADAVASILIGSLILPRTWALLRQAVVVLLEATPKSVDLDEVRTHVLAVPHVMAVHDLHASTVATGLPILSAHVVVEDGCFLDGHLTVMLDELQSCLAGHFDVEHSTFQFEAATHADHEHPTHA